MFDAMGVWVGVILTLLVFSYLLHDSPLFRIAQAIFVGVAVGYAATVAIRSVLIPRLFVPLLTSMDDQTWYLLIPPLVLGLLLFTKWRAEWASIGNISIAFLFGVGSALAIGGALSGALVPRPAAHAASRVGCRGARLELRGSLVYSRRLWRDLCRHCRLAHFNFGQPFLLRIASVWRQIVFHSINHA